MLCLRILICRKSAIRDRPRCEEKINFRLVYHHICVNLFFSVSEQKNEHTTQTHAGADLHLGAKARPTNVHWQIGKSVASRPCYFSLGCRHTHTQTKTKKGFLWTCDAASTSNMVFVRIAAPLVCSLLACMPHQIKCPYRKTTTTTLMIAARYANRLHSQFYGRLKGA